MGCDPCCSRPVFVPRKILFPPPYPTTGVGDGSYMLRVDEIERGVGGGDGRKRRTQGRGSGRCGSKQGVAYRWVPLSDRKAARWRQHETSWRWAIGGWDSIQVNLVVTGIPLCMTYAVLISDIRYFNLPRGFFLLIFLLFLHIAFLWHRRVENSLGCILSFTARYCLKFVTVVYFNSEGWGKIVLVI